MEQTPGKRVQIFREYKGYKKAAPFAVAAGLSAATLSSIETDRTSPSFDSMVALTTAFPDLNPDWLLLGTGPMLRDGKVLTPVEAPATTAPKVTTVPTAGVDPALHQEVKDSRDKAWELVDKKDGELARERAEKEYYRELWMQQVFGNQEGNAPATALPGKAETDSYAAVPALPSEPTGKTYIGMPERDETGNIKTKPKAKAKLATDNFELLESGELRLLAVSVDPAPVRAISLPEDEANAA